MGVEVFSPPPVYATVAEAQAGLLANKAVTPATAPAKANDLSDLASLPTARSNLGVGVVDDDPGATVSSTVAATTLLASSPLVIPGNSLAVGDVLTYRACGGSFNGTGAGRTITLNSSIGGTAFFAGFASAIANGALKTWMIQWNISVRTIGAVGALDLSGELIWGTDNSEVPLAADRRMVVKQIAAIDTTAAINVLLTTTMSFSSAALVTQCFGASIAKTRRMF